MNKLTLKKSLGLFLVISHFVIILLIILSYLIGGFLFDEMTTTLGLIVPMFGLYSTAIIKFIVATSDQLHAQPEPVSKAYVFVSFFIINVMCELSNILINK